MALNPYVDVNKQTNNANEQLLISNMVAEAIQFNGVEVVYLPRQMMKEDKIFHEDVISSFTTTYPIEAYIESFDGFEGNGDLLGAMGLTINDQVTLQFSQARFSVVVGSPRPLEGDLIYSKMSNTLFEIKFVEHEDQFYIAGTLPSFKVKCELYSASGETFNTGIAPIDAIDNIVLDAFGDNIDANSQAVSNNAAIQSESNLSINFSEVNPFGAP